jgi:hypothetical protein
VRNGGRPRLDRPGNGDARPAGRRVDHRRVLRFA